MKLKGLKTHIELLHGKTVVTEEYLPSELWEEFDNNPKEKYIMIGDIKGVQNLICKKHIVNIYLL